VTGPSYTDSANFSTTDTTLTTVGSVNAPAAFAGTGVLTATGTRSVVIVDDGEGRFRAQEVRIGDETNGKTEVLDGLKDIDNIELIALGGVRSVSDLVPKRLSDQLWKVIQPGAQPNKEETEVTRPFFL